MSKMDNGKMIVVIVGIVMLGAIEIMALYSETDGTALSVVVGGITLIIGYCFGIFKRGNNSTTDTKKV